MLTNSTLSRNTILSLISLKSKNLLRPLHLIEPLESRQYLTTSLSFTDDPGINNYYIRRSGDQIQVFQNQPLTATPVQQVPVSDIGNISIVYSSSNDNITLDYSGGDPIPGGLGYQAQTTVPAITPSLHVVGLANATYLLGSQTLEITASGIDDTVAFTNGTATTQFNLFSGGGTDLLKASSGASVNFASDLGGSGTTVNVNVSSGATVYFSATQHLNSLNIHSGGSVQMTPWGGVALDTNTLVVAGLLDLTNNDFVVNTPSTGDLTTLQEQVAAGVTAEASTSGIGSTQGLIYSSTAGLDSMTLGVSPAADLSPVMTQLDGQAVPSTALVACYTLAGDANLDGIVNFEDLSILITKFNTVTGTSPPQWYSGDFNYDGNVNFADLGQLANTYNTELTQATNITVGVPYSLTLPTTSPNGTPVRWDVNWGDGTFDSYGNIGSASHVFTTAGPGVIHAVAVTLNSSSSVWSSYRLAAVPLWINDSSAQTPLAISAGSSDAFNITADGEGNTVITQNGTVVDTVATDTLLSLKITGDTAGSLTVDYSNGDPLPASGLTTDSQNIDLTGGDDADTLVTTATTAIFSNNTINSSEIRHLSTASIRFLNAGSGDTLVALTGSIFINGDPTATDGPAVLVDSNTEVIFSGSQHLDALDVLAGGTARMAEDGAAVLVTDALSLAAPANGLGGGLLDLADNDLIVHGGSLSSITAWLAAGVSNSWTDSGNYTLGPAPAAIVSAVAASEQQQGHNALGLDVVGSPGTLTPGLFDGEPITTGDLVVRFGWWGDTNDDGQVNFTDFVPFSQNYGQSGNWFQGDFNYSGSINFNDLILLAQNYGNATYFNVPAAQQGQQYNLTLPGDMLENYFNLASISAWQVRWGDGTFSGMGVSPGDSADVTASHIYSNTDTGGYQLAIVAYGMDDDGNDVSYILPHQDVAVAPDAPGDLGVMESAPGAINLTWDDDDSFVTSYVATATPTAGGTTITHNLSGTATSTSFTGLNTSASYTFTVTATNTLSDGLAASSTATTLVADPPPPVPTNLTAAAVSSSEIDLAWTDNAANAIGDLIYESQDGGATFYPIDEIDSVMPGSASSYQVTGLNPGSSYKFFIAVAGSYFDLAASNTVTQSTQFVAPSLDVEGMGTVVEGQSYELDLTAEYPDGEPGAINHWLVDWNDGTGNTPDVVSYSYPTGSDPTQPLAVTHVFNAGIASANVTVTAVDSTNGSFIADLQDVSITPKVPGTLIASASGSTINMSWSSVSSISSDTQLLLSTDDVNFFVYGQAAAGATSGSITGVNLDTSYWVEAMTQGANGVSDTTAAVPVITPFVAPTLVVTPTNNAVEGQQYTLNLSATYPNTDPQDDLITQWQVDWGDGRGVQTYSVDPGNAVTPSSDYSTTPAWATVLITATDGTGRQFSYPAQSVAFAPNAPTNVQRDNLSDTSIDFSWQGQSNIAASYSVQEQAPGSTTWTTIATVAADSDGTEQNYSSQVTVASAAASDDSFQAIAQGAGSSAGADDGASSEGTPIVDPTVDGIGPAGYTLYMTPAGVTVGGESYTQIFYNGDIDTQLTVTSTNPDVISVLTPVVTRTEGDNGYVNVLVKANEYGLTQLKVEDGLGDMAECGSFSPTVPEAGSTGSVTEGASYSANNMPEFYFNVSPSVTPLEIHYNTDGSTLPSSLMGPLNSGEVTVPVGESSVYIPFTPANDGKVAAMRFAVVTTIVPGDDNPTSARMSVNSPAKPTVTIAGASDNAVIPVDPQGDDAKLVPIAMNVTYAGQLQNCSLEWDGTFIMWPTDKIGPPGTDLGSQPGAFHDPYNGTTSYTWDGTPPSVVYAQAIGGSINWDSTGVSLSANVIQPATSKVSAIQGEADKGAYGTADGPELIWDGKAVTGVMAGDMLIGQGASLQVIWEGPYPDIASSTFNWQVKDAVEGYYNGVVYPLTADDLDDDSVHFYWTSTGQNGGSSQESVQVSGTMYGVGFNLTTTFNVWTPSWAFGRSAIGTPTKGLDSQDQQATESVTLLDQSLRIPVGVMYTGVVTDNGLPAALAGGEWSNTQLATPRRILTVPGAGTYSQPETGVEGLDTTEPYGGLWYERIGNAIIPHAYAPVSADPYIFTDSPSDTPPIRVGQAGITAEPGDTFLVADSFRTFVMFQPPGDSIKVPLAFAHWSWTWIEKYNGNKWNFISPPPPGTADAAGSPTKEFPQWKYVVNAGDFHKD